MLHWEEASSCTTPQKPRWKSQLHRAFCLQSTTMQQTQLSPGKTEVPAAWGLSLHPLHCHSTLSLPCISAWDQGQSKTRHSSSLVTALSSQQGPSQAPGVQHIYTASHRQFTFLTLPGVWGPSTRRLMGVRGVLPYIISASIWRLFFRCCVRDLHLQTQAQQLCRAAEHLLATGCQGKGRLLPTGSALHTICGMAKQQVFQQRFTGIQNQAAVLAQLGPRKGLNTHRH